MTTIYRSERDSREIIVESFTDNLKEVQKEFIEKGYVITMKLDSFRFKAMKDDEEWEYA